MDKPFRDLVEDGEAEWTPLVLKVDHSYWELNSHPELRLIKVLHIGEEGYDSTVRVLAAPRFMEMIKRHGKVFTMGWRLEMVRAPQGSI